MTTGCSLTIGRITSMAEEQQAIRLTVRVGVSETTVEVSLEDFTMAVTGRSEVPAVLKITPNKQFKCKDQVKLKQEYDNPDTLVVVEGVGLDGTVGVRSAGVGPYRRVKVDHLVMVRKYVNE